MCGKKNKEEKTMCAYPHHTYKYIGFNVRAGMCVYMHMHRVHIYH